jgi:DNA repair protein RadA/Sms
MAVLAVLEKRGGLSLGGCDAYLNVIGGWSSTSRRRSGGGPRACLQFPRRVISFDTTAIGEVGLTREIRSVSALGQRLAEVRAARFLRCIIPSHVLSEITLSAPRSGAHTVKNIAR